MKYSTKRFYEIEQQKLLLDFEKVALFTQHPTSLGTFRENRLRQYLRDFTPRHLSLGTGFISEFDDHGSLVAQSRQIDCMVFDENRYHPELRTEDYAIIRPEAFFAAIEIKSELTFYKRKPKSDEEKERFFHERFGSEKFLWAGTLIDAIVNIKSINDAVKSRQRNCFLAVFGYSSSFKPLDLFRALANGEIQKQLGIEHIDQLPQSICVPGKHTICISPYDMTETAPHHEPYTSFMNVVESGPQSPAYPLQFFSVHYLNQIAFALNNEPVKRGGLNDGSSEGAGIKIWRDHFRLSSKGYEDQQ